MRREEVVYIWASTRMTLVCEALRVGWDVGRADMISSILELWKADSGRSTTSNSRSLRQGKSVLRRAMPAQSVTYKDGRTAMQVKDMPHREFYVQYPPITGKSCCYEKDG